MLSSSLADYKRDWRAAKVFDATIVRGPASMAAIERAIFDDVEETACCSSLVRLSQAAPYCCRMTKRRALTYSATLHLWTKQRLASPIQRLPFREPVTFLFYPHLRNRYSPSPVVPCLLYPGFVPAKGANSSVSWSDAENSTTRYLHSRPFLAQL
jgi:hypothetical protein